ncbi:MAG TPA: hypothetical protein VMR90_11705 [Candidatus Cybelea sp.]|nr:hypothetical protein [Candidatus Cybelea sp.]
MADRSLDYHSPEDVEHRRVGGRLGGNSPPMVACPFAVLYMIMAEPCSF